MPSEVTPMIPVPEIPDDVRTAWQEQGWSDDLLRRAYGLRVRRSEVDGWLRRGRRYNRSIQKQLERRERLIGGTLRIREATPEDNEALADLYAHSRESIGEWSLTTERGPYPFAQFRLQENVSIQVVEDMGVLLAAIAHSARNTLVGGHRITVQIESAWRTRREARGQGLGKLLRTAPKRALGWEAMATYYYRRQRSRKGRTANVECFPARPFEGSSDGIRRAQSSDIWQCVALINGTHEGLDLFRPYREEFLKSRLDDPCWGPKPKSWVPVYGWEDYYVLEEDGRVVACAGLWDRGKHVRDIWRHTGTDKSRVVENTALMDFGYAPGREDGMARLIEYLIGVTEELGRGQLMAPLQFLPNVTAALAGHEPVTERRPIYWQLMGEAKALGVSLTRPYTDLAYW